MKEIWKDTIPDKLPSEYKRTVYEYLNELIHKLGSSLKFCLLIGSASSGQVVIEWSDIDVILVINEYKMESISIINEVKAKSDIKIGNTVYSQSEFENKKLDPKTYYYLLLVQEKRIKIQYMTSDLQIPKVTINECKYQYFSWLMEHLHSYKRMWLYPNINNDIIKEIFKNTYLILKAILIIHGYRPQNYQEVFDTFEQEFSYPKFDFMTFIEESKQKKINKVKIIEYAIKLTEEISNNPEIYQEDS